MMFCLDGRMKIKCRVFKVPAHNALLEMWGVGKKQHLVHS